MCESVKAIGLPLEPAEGEEGGEESQKQSRGVWAHNQVSWWILGSGMESLSAGHWTWDLEASVGTRVVVSGDFKEDQYND